MNKTLRELLDGNPIVKAALYFLASAIPILGAGLAKWSETPPTNSYEIAAVLTAALGSGVVTLKAFTSNPGTKKPE